MTADRRQEWAGSSLERIPEVNNSWKETLGNQIYSFSMASMAGETKKGDGSWRVSNNNDHVFGGFTKGRELVAMVADGADGVGKWGGVLADKIISAVFETGLNVESLRRAVGVVSQILRTERVTIENVASTFTGAMVDVGGKMKILHLGDSRAYILNKGGTLLTKVTSDDDELHQAARKIRQSEGRGWEAAVKKAEKMGKRGNVLTNAVMTSADLADGEASVKRPFVKLVDLGSGETLMICSDGLEKYLSNYEIGVIMNDVLASGMGNLALALVKAAYTKAVSKKGEIRRIDAISVVTVSKNLP